MFRENPRVAPVVVQITTSLASSSRTICKAPRAIAPAGNVVLTRGGGSDSDSTRVTRYSSVTSATWDIVCTARMGICRPTFRR